MGVIRILLAASVVASHTGIRLLLPGNLAVECFFLVSGFLMSFILFEAKSYSKLSAFYLNRFLRIYPPYFFTLIISLFVITFSYNRDSNLDFLEFIREAPGVAKVFLIVTNISIIGQDILMFIGANKDGIFLTSNFRNAPTQMHQGLLIPQSWTLSLELYFYLLAPYLRKLRYILLLIAFSVCVKAMLISLGLGFLDPWSYRFFPVEIGFFAIGMLSHRLKNLLPGLYSSRSTYFLRVICILTVLSIVLFPAIPANEIIKNYTFIIVLAVALPYLFELSKLSKMDSILGEYSFPLFLIHTLALKMLLQVDFLQMSASLMTLFITTILISLFFSYLMRRFIIIPLDQVRNKNRHISRG